MSDDTFDEDPILSLFQQEMRQAGDSIQSLLGPMAAPLTALVSEPLVLAARTVRGCSKLLGLDILAELAIQLETHFAKVSEGDRLESALPRILQAAALFRQVGEPTVKSIKDWQSDHREELQSLVQSLQDAPVAPPPAPPPSPTPVSAPATVSINATLFDLFREEARSHSETLTNGLIELESDPANPQRIEPLMRAAHSIKGAARIVGIDLAVDLSHVLEDVFVAAQRGKLRLVPEDIDVFLKATDLFAGLQHLQRDRMAEWSQSHSAEIQGCIQALKGILTGNRIAPAATTAPKSATPISPSGTPSATSGDPVPIVVAAKPEVASKPPSPKPAPESGTSGITPAPRVEVPPATPGPPASADEEDTIVRVSAQSLNRFMGLAGESLVQARWLQPFANSLLKFKKIQDRLARSLDTFVAWQATHPMPESAREIVDDMRRQISDCQSSFAQRMAEFEEYAASADDLNLRLYREVISSRMRPFSDGTHGFARIVRDMSRHLGKKVKLEIQGLSTEVDRDILEKLDAPLTHMLRNAIDHGLEFPDERMAAGKSESGTLKVEARHRAGTLIITITDDGRGIDPEKIRTKIVDRGMVTAEMATSLNEQELLEFLFLPGFSTAKAVTEYSGRGVGLDVVQEMVRVVGGTVRITTRPGQGTTFHLQLPVTLSVVRAVLVVIAGESYAFPHNRIDRLLRLKMSDVHSLENRQFVNIDGKNVGLLWASQLLGLPAPPRTQESVSIVLIADISGQYGLIVDCFTGEQDLVVRPLDSRLGKIPNISAAAVLDDGSPVLIADVEDMLRSAEHYIQSGNLKRTQRLDAPARNMGRKRVLVVDDSVTVREVERQLLREMGHEVIMAVDGQDGWNRLRSEHFDLVVSDIDMPRMNGLDLLRMIRNDSQYAELPVIIVSYKDRDEERNRGLELGADYYLMKSSFHDNTFRQAVEDVLSR